MMPKQLCTCLGNEWGYLQGLNKKKHIEERCFANIHIGTTLIGYADELIGFKEDIKGNQGCLLQSGKLTSFDRNSGLKDQSLQHYP